MNLLACITYLYPDARAGVDFDLIDRGEGPEILKWALDAPQPALQELEAVSEMATVSALKDAKIAEINTAFTQAASSLTAGYPEAERMTWATQQQEALAWEADANAPTPYLDGLATARGITSEEMRQKTLDQTQLFMVASQQLVGKRQRLRDLVYEAERPDDLDAIQWDEPAA